MENILIKVARVAKSFRNFIMGLMLKGSTNASISKEYTQLKPEVEIEKMSEERQVKKRKSRISLEDPQVKHMVYEVLDYYGYPPSSEGCLNKQEKIMHVFGLMAVLQSLNRDEDLTNETLSKESEEVADFFCRKYYEKYGHHVIPSEEETKNPDIFKILKVGPGDERKEQESPKLDKTRSKEES